jgi:hypothetical protein
MRRIEDSFVRELRAALDEAYAPDRLDQADRNTRGDDEHPSEFALASYLERRLHGAEEEAFERHVAFCPACAQELMLARRSGVGKEERGSGRGWKIAATLAIAMAGLISALIAAREFGSRVEAAILARIEGAFGGKAAIEDISLSWSGGPGVDLHGLRLRDDTTESSDPLLVAPSARVALDARALGRGQVMGTLKLDRPILNVVRDASGRLNLDAVLPKKGLPGGGPHDLLARIGGKLVDQIEVSSGTVRLIDRSGEYPHELRMAAVDAKLTGLADPQPAHVEARAGLESSSHNVTLIGEVGPWGGSAPPEYHFSTVDLNSIPLRSLPQIGAVMRGGLSYTGGLASSGESWDEIRDHLSGEGEATVVSGAIAGRNLLAEVLSPLVDGHDLGGGIGTLVAAADTGFNEISGHVTIADTQLASTRLALAGNGFSVEGRASLGLDGQVQFDGELRIHADTTRDLLAAAPGAAALVNERGEVVVPFTIAGAWPDINAHLNIERLAARARRHMLVRFRFGLPLPLVEPILGRTLFGAPLFA